MFRTDNKQVPYIVVYKKKNAVIPLGTDEMNVLATSNDQINMNIPMETLEPRTLNSAKRRKLETEADSEMDFTIESEETRNEENDEMNETVKDDTSCLSKKLIFLRGRCLNTTKRTKDEKLLDLL